MAEENLLTREKTILHAREIEERKKDIEREKERFNVREKERFCEREEEESSKHERRVEAYAR